MGLFDSFKSRRQDGPYRPHAASDSERLTDLAKAAFPEFANRISCFGMFRSIRRLFLPPPRHRRWDG